MIKNFFKAVSQQHQMPIQPRQQNGFQQSSNESFVAVAAYRFVGGSDPILFKL